jgi:glycine C-acetyltransferase
MAPSRAGLKLRMPAGRHPVPSNQEKSPMAYPDAVRQSCSDEINAIRQKGTYKEKRFLCSPQAAEIEVEYPEGSECIKVLNFCANNYLGFSSHPEVIKAAHEGLDARGFGMSSVRFICGTQDIHRELQDRVTAFLGMEDTLLFPSCMDANGGVFEAILGKEDVVIPDRLIHASLIDGIRLCKAERDIYEHMDMNELREKLEKHQDKRRRMIVTDGVFSMDGDLCPLDEICALAGEYDAMVLVDDSHATGFIGKKGRGVHEHFGVMDQVDVITTTFGKALGGASGGCVSGRRELVELCRQKARPYLFSNSLSPVIVSATIKVIDLLSKTTELRDRLEVNTKRFRHGIAKAGLNIREGVTPIVPVMLYNARLANDMARDMYAEGIYVIGFFYPVVGKGLARIRVQLSAGHEMEHIDKAIAAFIKIGKKYDILKKSKDEIIAKYGL